MSVSYLQIYNEKIFDLLSRAAPAPNGLRLRYIDGIFVVENLYKFECRSAPQALELLQFGLRNRAVAAHKFNLSSSRSHCIFTLSVDSVDLANSVSCVSITIG